LEQLNLTIQEKLVLKILIKKISIAVAYISVWEIILGFGGDLISFGSLKLRALLAVLNVVLLVIGVVVGSTKVKLPYLVLSSISLIVFINLLWTLYGLEIGNEFAIDDGGGSLLSILSCLSVIVTVLDTRLSKATVFNLLQLPLLIFFSTLSFLWTTQPISGINLPQIMRLYTSVEIIGGGGDLGRYYFPSTIILPLSAFIFAVYSQKFGMLKFYMYLALYILSVFTVGSRGVAIGTLSIVFTAFIIKVFALQKKPIYLMIFLSPLLIAVVFLSPFGSENLKSTRFFEPKAEESQIASNNTRFEQAPLLLESFFVEPIMGRGFGYYISGFLRSSKQPYLYELYFLNFLMKTGILGSFLYCSALMAILIAPFVSKFRYRSSVKVLYFVAFITTIIQGASNPLLDRPSGLLLLFGPWLTIELLRRLSADFIVIQNSKGSQRQSPFTTQVMI
jgi:hypothetical protein